MANDSGNSSVLFICHESSRTGAPLILLNFLRWVKKNTSLSFSIIIRKSGELDDEFRALAPLLILFPAPSSFFLKRWLARFIASRAMKKKISRFIKRPVNLVYSNTFSNGELAAWLKEKYNAKLITHVHELSGVIDSLGESNLNFVCQSTDRFIAASVAVKKTLTARYHIPEGIITVIYEFLVSFGGDSEVPPSVGKMIRENNKTFVVGAVGFSDYRKGFDLFLETCRIVINDIGNREIFFLWVGDSGRGKMEMVEEFIQTNHLSGHILFTGPVRNPSEYYDLFDLVFLPSREDPFPLAMIESAWHRKPVICFSGSGGMNEFIDETTGILIDDFDTSRAAREIASSASERDRLSGLGRNARTRVEESFLAEKIAPELYGVIKGFIKQNV